MMNIPPSEANALSLWQYEALLHNWNKAHDTDGEVAPPDHHRAQAHIDRINADPKLHTKTVKKPARA